MGRGIYTLTSGALVLNNIMARDIENLTNAETKGYKSSLIKSEEFEPYMLVRKNGNKINPLISCSDGIYTAKVETRYEQGEIQDTGRNLDIAISGDGFFELEGENESRLLTREGNFIIDEEGYLAAANGKRVIGENGTLKLDTDKFELDTDGTIISESGEKLGKLTVYYTEKDSLIRTDNNCFLAKDAQAATLPNDKTQLIQKSLENSNVNTMDEMVNVLEYSKLHDTYAKSLKNYEDLDRKVISQILGSI